MQVSETLLQDIAVTAELTNTQLSTAAARVLADELSRFPEHQVHAALARCRRELQHRLTVAAVIERLDDGRPGAEEAFAMLPRNEHESVYWCDEAREAARVALPLIAARDQVGARMAFKERFSQLVQRNRDRGVPVRWSFSFGLDSTGRERAIHDAVERGRLSPDHARALLPHLDTPPTEDGDARDVESLARQLVPPGDKQT